MYSLFAFQSSNFIQFVKCPYGNVYYQYYCLVEGKSVCHILSSESLTVKWRIEEFLGHGLLLFLTLRF